MRTSRSTPKLADWFGRRAVVNGMINWPFRGEAIQHDFIAFATTLDHTAARPNVRGKARARDRITKGEGSQHFADCSILASSFLDKDAYAVGFEVEAGPAVCIEDEILLHRSRSNDGKNT
jgi:hypothetical protein